MHAPFTLHSSLHYESKGPGPSAVVPCDSFCSICLTSACGTPSCVARMVARYICN